MCGNLTIEKQEVSLLSYKSVQNMHVVQDINVKVAGNPVFSRSTNLESKLIDIN